MASGKLPPVFDYADAHTPHPAHFRRPWYKSLWRRPEFRLCVARWLVSRPVRVFAIALVLGCLTTSVTARYGGTTRIVLNESGQVTWIRE
jgi:hypothetical protein